MPKHRVLLLSHNVVIIKTAQQWKIKYKCVCKDHECVEGKKLRTVRFQQYFIIISTSYK